MINTDDFIKRLEQLMEYYGISASNFADKIGVQRSSLSHLLSGRNKPSLDFSLKIIEEFPDVDLYWLLIGKGTFPKSEIKHAPTPTPIVQVENKNVSGDLFSEIEEPIINQKETPKVTFENVSIPSGNESEIEKIVLFYKDGTFKSYNPK